MRYKRERAGKTSGTRDFAVGSRVTDSWPLFEIPGWGYFGWGVGGFEEGVSKSTLELGTSFETVRVIALDHLDVKWFFYFRVEEASFDRAASQRALIFLLLS